MNRICARAFSFGLVAYLFLLSLTAAQDAFCPSGPFEIDRAKIAAALATLPVLPRKLTRERQSSTKPEAWTFTDGIKHGGGGGLAAPYQEGHWVGLSGGMEYDATRYLARWIQTEERVRRDQTIEERYITKIARPSVEQARAIACLVNQLLEVPTAPAEPEPAPAGDPSAIPTEIVVVAPRRPVPCSFEFTDGHWEYFGVLVANAPAAASKMLSCSDVGRLEESISRAVGAPFAQ
jgi:hypothetical protein